MAEESIVGACEEKIGGLGRLLMGAEPGGEGFSLHLIPATGFSETPGPSRVLKSDRLVG
jgi:hypothetical protein